MFLEGENKLLKHVGNHNQREKFDLNLKERERRNELNLGNAWVMESVGGERRDYASSTMSSWRVRRKQDLTQILEKHLLNTFTLSKRLIKSSKNSC